MAFILSGAREGVTMETPESSYTFERTEESAASFNIVATRHGKRYVAEFAVFPVNLCRYRVKFSTAVRTLQYTADFSETSGIRYLDDHHSARVSMKSDLAKLSDCTVSGHSYMVKGCPAHFSAFTDRSRVDDAMKYFRTNFCKGSDF